MTTAFAAIIVIAAVTFWHSTNPGDADKLTVVATFYPLAYFAKEIGGEYVSVLQLIPHNTEVHSWQPSVSGIVAVDEADIVIYNGANLDDWFETDILPSINQGNKIIVETTEGVGLLETDGLLDPHTWISPFVARQQAQKIHLALVQKDPEHEQYYDQRWQELKTRFEQLDNNYMAELSNAQEDVIFVTHAAFGYLAARYGFEQYGVIGLSADEQPSAFVIADLVEMMLNHETYVVYVDPVYSDEYAQALKDTLEIETGQSIQILNLYFMLGPFEGMDYFEQQESNLNSLKLGLEA